MSSSLGCESGERAWAVLPSLSGTPDDTIQSIPSPRRGRGGGRSRFADAPALTPSPSQRERGSGQRHASREIVRVVGRP